MEGKPHYAIAGDWLTFRRWQWEDPQGRKDVDYLTADRAKKLVRRGAPKGMLLRLPGWETSAARKAAEVLELAEELRDAAEEDV